MVSLICCHGDVAQLARALGSYPIGREFESPRRYQYEIYSNFDSSFFLFKNHPKKETDIIDLKLSKEKDDIERQFILSTKCRAKKSNNYVII